MTLKAGKKPAGPLAADANVLLSAVSGGAARKVFLFPSLKIISVKSVCDEVLEYLPHFAKKSGVPIEALKEQWDVLAVEVIEKRIYEGKLKAAAETIENRDPDDINLLALALSKNCPIWSNDKDFEGLSVETWPTAKLLKAMEQLNPKI